MMFLLSLLGRPAILAGLVGGLAIGGLGLWLKIEKGRHARDVAALTLQIKDEQLKAKNEETARRIVETNRADLQRTLDSQSAEIAKMAITAQAAQASAVAAALRAVEAGHAQAEELRQPTTTVAPGHVPLNEWLQKRLEAQ